ncbi:MAG: restriction endonuclease subunit S, partial [Ruminococcus sp.]|nr:restriction endonuclease subunit S [Ruminococcus sp.]
MTKLDTLINQLCPNGVEYLEINNTCKITTSKIKIKSHDYLKQGLFPIIDQGKDFIGGYTNNANTFPKDKYII